MEVNEKDRDKDKETDEDRDKQKGNHPDRAMMRPDCVFACIEYVTYIERQMDEQ